MPDFRQYGVKVAKPGATEAENTKPLGNFLRDVMRNNMTNFRVFGPDENTSNKLDDIYEASKKFWIAEYFPEDADGGELSIDGRVMEMLSEHTLEGWLEGYLLTGRHGFFATYESFVHVIDSMVNEHANGSRSAITSLEGRRLFAESVDHLHRLAPGSQRVHSSRPRVPGYRANKSPEIVRVYLPPDVNSLLSVADHCLRSNELRQCDRLRQATALAVPGHGHCCCSLQQGPGHLGLGQHGRR